jgi:nucleoid-associated protein YgaU
MKRLALLMTVVGVVALYIVGCDSSKEQELQFFQEKNQELTQRVAELEDQLESVQKTNQWLTQRVAELEGQLRQTEAEDQLRQAEAIAPTIKTDVQSSIAESIYIVVEGDSLWNIAEEQFGDGNLYTEILTLNPQIEEDEPLFVGTKLKMPPNR